MTTRTPRGTQPLRTAPSPSPLQSVNNRTITTPKSSRQQQAEFRALRGEFAEMELENQRLKDSVNIFKANREDDELEISRLKNQTHELEEQLVVQNNEVYVLKNQLDVRDRELNDQRLKSKMKMENMRVKMARLTEKMATENAEKAEKDTMIQKLREQINEFQAKELAGHPSDRPGSSTPTRASRQDDFFQIDINNMIKQKYEDFKQKNGRLEEKVQEKREALKKFKKTLDKVKNDAKRESEILREEIDILREEIDDLFEKNEKITREKDDLSAQLFQAHRDFEKNNLMRRDPTMKKSANAEEESEDESPAEEAKQPRGASSKKAKKTAEKPKDTAVEKLKCVPCGLKFARPFTLIRHNKTKHDNGTAKKYNCDKCGYTTLREDAMIVHLDTFGHKN